MDAFEYRRLLGNKLVSVETAMGEIASGSTVGIAAYSCTPFTLCQALADRGARGDVERVRIEHPAAGFAWTDPRWAHAFHLVDNYATPANRRAVHAGESDYLPIGRWKEYQVPLGWSAEPDFYLVPVSPPDESGYCSFGPGVWFSRSLVPGAKKVIAEIQPHFIRTGGENYVHVSEIDVFVEGLQQTGSVPAPPPSAEEAASTEVICNLVAAELINDGDTLQMGVGTVAASLAPFLGFRNDLGIQTELITGGIAGLVRDGVVNGKYKSIHKGKVVGSALVALDDAEMQFIDRNPVFELYDFGYTDDLRRLIHIENFVTVNNALIVDLTGQIAAESFDHQPYTGVGGQTVFMIAGAYSPGGKSVSVLPSSSVPTSTGQRVSRIVGGFPPGTPVTVPRTYVDFVVTEHGIAELRGKTVAERAGSLIEIAHPEFRDELRAEAKRLYAQ